MMKYMYVIIEGRLLIFPEFSHPGRQGFSLYFFVCNQLKKYIFEFLFWLIRHYNSFDRAAVFAKPTGIDEVKNNLKVFAWKTIVAPSGNLNLGFRDEDSSSLRPFSKALYLLKSLEMGKGHLMENIRHQGSREWD